MVQGGGERDVPTSHEVVIKVVQGGSVLNSSFNTFSKSGTLFNDQKTYGECLYLQYFFGK